MTAVFLTAFQLVAATAHPRTSLVSIISTILHDSSYPLIRSTELAILRGHGRGGMKLEVNAKSKHFER